MQAIGLDLAPAPDRAFRRVLICLDGSVAAEAAIGLAEHLAALDEGRVILLHVLDVASDPASAPITDALAWEVGRRRAFSYLREVAQRLAVPCDVRVVEGSAGARIAAMIDELDVDLTAITSVGEGGPGEWRLGGTARKALSLTSCPLLVVPALGSAPRVRVPPKRILVPLDGTKRGESVLSTATRIAQGAGAEVVLAHVVDEPTATEILSDAADLDLAHQLAGRQAVHAAHYLARVAERLEASGVDSIAVVRTSIDHGEGLLAAGDATGADLIVLSAHGATCNARRPLGAVASHVVHHASIPVLVIQDLPGRAPRAGAAKPATPRVSSRGAPHVALSGG